MKYQIILTEQEIKQILLNHINRDINNRTTGIKEIKVDQIELNLDGKDLKIDLELGV